MTNQNKTGYMIYDFMIEALGLSGIPLLVFSLIYSFTRSDKDCYGTLEYIAKRVGASSSSVKSALKLLRERELIIKRSDNIIRTKIYSVNLATLKTKVFDKPEIDRSESNLVESIKSPSLQTNSDYNNKEIINTTTTTTTTRESEREDPCFLLLGNEELVMMTMEQHIDLRNRLGSEIVEYYINRLEGCLISRPDMYLKNHYKTILKWAQEDADLDR